MPKLTPTKATEVIRVLQKLGFNSIRQSGSHAVYYHPGEGGQLCQCTKAKIQVKVS